MIEDAENKTNNDIRLAKEVIAINAMRKHNSSLLTDLKDLFDNVKFGKKKLI